MTIAATITAETMLGNGVNRNFPFTFRAWAGEVRVVVTDPAGQEADVTALADIAVYEYEDEGSQPGGVVSYPAAELSPALPAGWKITVLRDMNMLQTTRLVNAARFDPVVMERSLDRLAATDQQLAEQMGRAVTVPVGSEVTPDDLLESVYEARDNAEAAANNAAASESAAAGGAAGAEAARTGAEVAATSAGASAASAQASATAAANSATSAEDGADLSWAWANTPHGTPVKTDPAPQYSALHWAVEAMTGDIPDATETTRGVVAVATQAEAESGITSPGRDAGQVAAMTPERTKQAIAAQAPGIKVNAATQADTATSAVNAANAATATLAASADKLATARTIRTNLASTAAASFDGTANITPGVTGTLPLANGGTGVTTLAALQSLVGGNGAPKPVNGGTGVGAWVVLTAINGQPNVIPAGGTWAYFIGSGTANSSAGTAAGGTTLSSTAGVRIGFCWRIA